MKNLFFFILILISCNFSTVYSQSISTSGGSLHFVKSGSTDVSDEMKKINHKKYLTTTYIEATVNTYNNKAFLRYNIFLDEMEFVKDNQIYFLHKEPKMTISFKSLNKKYVTFKESEKLGFYVEENLGVSKLLSKEVVVFKEAKKAQTSYGSDSSADYKKKKDIYFFSFDGVNVIKVPRKKKKFYTLFGENSSKIKKFIKKERLKIKKKKDLKKIINYYNTL